MVSGGFVTVVPPETMFQSQNGGAGYAFTQMEKVVGKVPDHMKNDFLGEQSRTHQDFTELMLSRAAPLVPQMVTGLLLKTYVSPFTSFLLPIRELGPGEGNSSQWMEINFDQGLAPQIEVEGVARLYTHNKTQRGAVAVRRGVAVEVETSFWMTDEGRALWKMQIQQLATIIQRTNEYDVMMTLLQTPLSESRHAHQLGGSGNQMYGVRPNMGFEDRIKLEVDWFAIVNKSEDSRGFSNLCTALRVTMKKAGVEPDAMVVPPNLLGYYLYTSPDLWEHSSAGPDAAKNRKMAEDVGPDNGIRAQEFQGMRLVDTHVARMTAGANGEAGDLLTVPKQIGEFYPMLTSNAFEDLGEFAKCQSKRRNIRIFNEDHSRMVPVKFSEAIAESLRWDENGALHPERHQAVIRDGKDDMFVTKSAAGPARLCGMWADMEDKWLSTDSVDNVVASIKSKIDPIIYKELNFDITKYQQMSSFKTIARTLKDETGVRVALDTTKSIDENGEFNRLKSLYSETYRLKIENILLRLVMAALPDDAMTVMSEVLAYIVSVPVIDDIKGEADMEWESAVLTNSPHAPTWLAYLASKNSVDRVIAFMFLTSTITKRNMIGFDKNDFYVPVDFVLCRPYMTYNVSSVIVMKAGTETGETLIGSQKFEMTTNIGTRMMYGNYFYYGKAVVKRLQNVIVAPSVFIQQYVKGNNTTFVGEAELGEIHEVSGLLDSEKSILAFMTKVDDPVTDSNLLDIRGNHPLLACPKQKQTYYATAPYYRRVLDIDPLGLCDPSTEFMDFENMNIRANSICHLGHTEDYAGKIIYTNTGHLGSNTYDQVNKSRTPGHYTQIKHQTYNMKLI